MAISFVGAGTFTLSTAAPTITLPTGYAAGDLLLLVVGTANQAVSVTSPAGWTQIGTLVGTGTAASATAAGLAAFWKVAAATESSVVLSDSGAYTGGVIVAYRGTSSTPIAAFSTGTQATASTAWTAPGITIAGEDQSIVWLIMQPTAVNSSNGITALTNTVATNDVERVDTLVKSGSQGGGVAVYDSLNPLPVGTVVPTSSVTSANSSLAAFITLAIRPNIIELDTNTNISLTSASSLTNKINLAGDTAISLLLTPPNLITPVITLAGSFTFSVNTSASINTLIRLASASTIQNIGTANLLTDIKLSGTTNIVNTSSANISTSIKLASNSNIIQTGIATLYNYASFAAASNITTTSAAILKNYAAFNASSLISTTSTGSINTSIRLGTSSSLSLTSTAILKNYAALNASTLISLNTSATRLTNLSLFQASSTLSINSNASLRLGVLLNGTTSLSINTKGFLLPDWARSNLVFDSRVAPVFDTLLTKYGAFNTFHELPIFTPIRITDMAGSEHIHKYSSDKSNQYDSPINRL